MKRIVCYGIVVALLGGCGGGGAKITDAGVIDTPSIDAVVVEIDGGPIGHPGTGTVTGAVKASSPNYTLYGTLRSGDGSSTSPSYLRRGGITGATQP